MSIVGNIIIRQLAVNYITDKRVKDRLYDRRQAEKELIVQTATVASTGLRQNVSATMDHRIKRNPMLVEVATLTTPGFHTD